MALTFELAGFAIAEGAETALIAERPSMIAALERTFPGVLAAWLTKLDDGTWLDVVLWRSREEAEEAAHRINDVPEAKRWFRHIAESNGLQHVAVAEEHLFQLRRVE
jgi:L-aminopeptidase/D-esterase-like protein